MATAGASTPSVPVDPTEMRAGLTPEEVCLRLARAARHEETGRRVLAFYLVEMDARRLYLTYGHQSTAHYAETRLGLDRRRVAELIRVGARLLELPHVDRAFCEGRLGWAKVLVLARMAVPAHEAAWLERALALDVRDLTLLAARSREGGAPRPPGDEKGLPEIRFPLAARVSPLLMAKLEQAQRRLGDERGRAVDFTALLDAMADLFLSVEADDRVPGHKRLDASIYRVVLEESTERGAPLRVVTEEGSFPIDGGGAGREGAWSEALRCDAGVRNHHVPTAQAHGGDDRDHRARDRKTPDRMRGRVLRRDRSRCRSCRSRQGLMVHHIEFRSHGGRTLPRNLISVCSTCHGLLHEGLLRIQGACVETARFFDAFGRPIEGPQEVAALEAVARMSPPVRGEIQAGCAAGGGGGASGVLAPIGATPLSVGGVVTLLSMPSEVDGAWWSRHAHLVRDRGEGCDLRFQPGTPMDPPETADVAPEEDSEPADPSTELVGQDERVARLRRVAQGSRALGKPYPHVLLCGPAGTGKTTLALAIGKLAGLSLVEVPAPVLTDRVTLVRMLAGLREGCALFLDEVHALPRPLLELLLEALSERRLSLVLSDGTSARRVTLRLPRFTLLAATTDEGALPSAFRSRFGLRETLVHFEEGALAELVRHAATRVGFVATEGGARRLAAAARGTPREALRLLDRALEDAATTATACLDEEGVTRTLRGLDYDADGLDRAERRYLEVLRQSAAPVPLSRLATTLGTTPRTLSEHVEPCLFERRLVRMTPAGRVAVPRGRSLPHEADAPNVRRGAPPPRPTP